MQLDLASLSSCKLYNFTGLLTYLVFFSRPEPKNEDEMMILIFEYIDRIISCVRPRRLIYMAIDGVVSVCHASDLVCLFNMMA